jgi:FkbM family methyltransferase
MSIRDAVRVVFAGKDKEVPFRIASVDREVTVRAQTTDVRCLEKIFLHQEYKPLFSIAPKVIVDGGANIGLSTLFFAREYPQAKIIAIEPELSNFTMLQKNCGHLPHVTLVRGAIWSKTTPLVIGNPSGEKWSFTVTNSSTPATASATEVEAVTIPSLLHRLGETHIDLLKLDIEGAERDLFMNGAEAWIGAVSVIIIELHDWMQPGCSKEFYAAIGARYFSQSVRGENIFVKLGN